MTILRLLLATLMAATALAVMPVGYAAAAIAPAVSGVLTRDLNANDLLEAGEPPLAGVSVVLRDATTGLVVAGPVVTGTDGAYVFETLAPGTYQVAIDSPTNYLVSSASADNAFSPTGDQTTGITAPITIGVADDLTANGLIRPRPELSVGYFAVGSEDGATPFNSTGTCSSPLDSQIDGEDCGSDNGVVRSADPLNLSVSITADNFEPGAADLQNVIYEVTITNGPGADADFDRIPAVCSGTNPVSSIVTNADGSITLTCNVGSMAEGAAKTFTTSIIPAATSTNGSTFEVEQRVYSVDDDGIENAVPDELVPDFGEYTISSAPAYDLIKKNFRNQDVLSRTINGETLLGYITYFTFGIAADRAIGVEQLEQPFTITDSITAVGSDGVTPVPNFEYYITECRPNPSGWGDSIWGAENYRADRPITEKVIQSGTCAETRTNPADPSSDYEFTLSGIDMSGTRYPTRTIGGTDLSAGPFYVAFYRVQVFIPFRVIDGADGDGTNGVGAIQLSNELSGFDPDSPSGTSNFGDGFEPGYDGALMDDGGRSNNIVGPTTFQLTTRGSWAKYLRNSDNNINGVSNGLIPGQSGGHSGDGEIEPGQLFHGLIPYTNNGTSPHIDPRVCDTFDNSTMVLTTNDFSSDYAFVGRYDRLTPYNAAWPANWIVEYASIPYTGDNPLDNNGDGVPDFNASTGRYDGNWDTQRAARCSDVPDSDWNTDANAVAGGIDAVNAVRVRAVDPARGLQAGEQVRLVVPLTAREDFFGGPNNGDPIPTGTVLANFGAVRSDQYSPNWSARNYRPSPETTNGDGDRVTLTRAQIRLQKHTISPATNVGETGSTVAGNQIVWELLPTTSASTSGAVVRDIVITDVLPPELTYNADCTTAQAGGTPANQVLFDTPGPGQTTLIWNLGDRQANEPIAPLIYCTDTDPLAPNGTAVSNDAVMESSNTVSSLPQRSDTHTMVLEQVGSIQVSKQVDLTLDDTDDNQIHTLGFGNFSANFQIAAPTLIDVIPYNGDGTFGNPNFRDPASDFSGTYHLTGPPTVTWFDGSVPGTGDPFPELGTFTYSADTPNTISLNPDADAAANTTTWCSYNAATGTFTQVSGPAGGTCPTDFPSVTAFKFVSNYDLEIDGDPRQGMNITTDSLATGNEPGDIYTNRFGLDSSSLPPSQFLRSNNVTVRVAAFSIGDFIFTDADGNGRFDPGSDVPAPDGVPVELRRPDGTLIATTDTSVLGGGRYLFPDLGSGDYIVTIPASAFQAGGVLEDWIVTPPTGVENDDLNELDDQHGFTTGTEIVDGVTTGVMTLSAIPPGPGQVPIGEEPTGENVAGIFDLTLDDFSNLTLDIGLIGPPDVQIVKEVCSTGSSCDVNAAVGAGGWVKTTLIQFNDDATFRITVINTGGQQLVDLEVTDPTLADCNRTTTSEPGLDNLSPNASVSWTCTQTNVVAGALNTATVEGAGRFGGDVDDSDSAEIETPPSDPAILVVKSVNGDDANTLPGIYVGVGDPTAFTYTVTNPGSVPLEDVTLVDDAGTPADPTDDVTFVYADLVSGDTDGDTRLDPNETWEFGPHNATATPGQYTNWATVTGDPTNGDPDVTDNDPANVFGSDGGLALKKYVNDVDADTAPGVYIPEGAPAIWTYVVTNTGNIALTDVTLTDDSGTPAAAGDDVTLSSADLVSGDTDGDGELDTNETWRFQIDGVAIAGAYVNIGTAEGTIPGVTTPATATDPANYFGLTSGITIEKATNTVDADSAPGPVIPVGDPVTWTYVVTNQGNTALSGVTVTDDAGTPGTVGDDVTLTVADLISGDTNGDDLLDPSETWTFEIDGVATSGQYTNIGDVTGTAPATTNPDGSTTPGADVTDDDPSNYLGSDPAIELIKRVNNLDANAAPGVNVVEGGPVTWTYTVTNPGSVALSDVVVADDAGTPADAADDFNATYVSGDANSDGLLGTDETWTFTATGVATAGQYTNIAEVTGTAPDTTDPDGSTTPGVDVTDDDPANHYGITPAIGVVKTVNGEDANTAPGIYVPIGDPITWTYTVTNEGNIALTDVVVADDAGTPGDAADDFNATYVSGDANGNDFLDTDETWTFTATGVATAGQYTNVADATGTTPDTVNPDGSTTPGVDVTDDDPANSFGTEPAIEIVKTINGQDANTAPGVYVPVGDPITWTYTVTNPGNIALAGVGVIDDGGTPAVEVEDFDDDFPPTYLSGDTNNDGLLDIDETWIFEATDVAIDGLYTNVAVASGNAPDTVNPDGSTTSGVELTDDDPANYYGIDPGIAVVKTVNGENANIAPGVYVPIGDPITWTYTVTNEGNIALADVNVNDDAGTPGALGDDFTLTTPISGDTNNDGLLDIDETWTFEATGVATAGQYTNIGEATGTAPDTTNPDGTTTPGVDVTDDDPANSYGTTPEISLVKSVNTDDANTAPGALVTNGGDVTWTYAVANDGNVALTNVTIVDDAGTPADSADDVTLTATDLVRGDTNGDEILDVDETWSFSVDGIAIAGQYTNIAVVTADAPDTIAADGSTVPGVEVTDNDPANSYGTIPGIAVVKTVNGEDANDAPGPDIASGGDILWAYTVTNTGNIALANITVVDDNGTSADPGDDITLTTPVSGDTNSDGLLDVDETWVFELTGVATPGPYVNIAEVTGTAPDTVTPDGSVTPGVDVTDDDPANHLGSDAAIAIVKTVNTDDANVAPGIFVPVDDDLTWTYTVTNPGTVVIANVAVVDDAGTPGDPADDVTFTSADLVDGDTNDDGILDLDETWVFELPGVATPGPYVNNAVATGTAPDTVNPDGSINPGVDVTDENPANHYGFTTGIDIVKSVNGEDANVAPGPLVDIGDEVSWTYDITNTGNTWLTGVTVGDDQGVTVTCPATVLAPAGDADGADTMTCTGGPEAAPAGQYTNIGTATGTPVVPNPEIDPTEFDPTNPEHTVPVVDPTTGEPVTAPEADDPANSFGSGPAIEILKDVCLDSANCDVDNDSHWGDTAEVATGTEAIWRITVNNIGNVALSDVVVNDPLVADCDRTIGDLAVGESTAYSCADPELALIDDVLVNLADATGTSPTGETVVDDDEASITSPGSYSIAKRVTTNGTIRVGDTVEYELVVTNDGLRTLNSLEVMDTPGAGLEITDAGSGTVVDGTLTWILDDLMPGESVVLTYRLEVTTTGLLPNTVSVLSGTQVVVEDNPIDNTATALITATARPRLAYTGSSVFLVVMVGMLLIAAGGALVLPARRRRAAE